MLAKSGGGVHSVARYQADQAPITRPSTQSQTGTGVRNSIACVNVVWNRVYLG